MKRSVLLAHAPFKLSELLYAALDVLLFFLFTLGTAAAINGAILFALIPLS